MPDQEEPEEQKVRQCSGAANKGCCCAGDREAKDGERAPHTGIPSPDYGCLPPKLPSP